MTQKKIIAVVGATGAQGGGLARAILGDKDSPFQLRALTRNPDSDKGKALANAGAEVVQADLDNTDSLVKAFEGAYGAFCVTNFWEHFSPEKEIQQAENLAKAAKEAGVSHVIWSTFDDTREKVPLSDDRMPTLQEKYKVPHFDSKGSANKYFEEYGVPTTLLNTSFYWDNLIHFGMGPKPGPDGTLTFTLPMGDKPLSGIAAEDIGACAYGIFKEGDKYINSKVGIAGGHLTGSEMAEALTNAIGQKVVYYAVDADTYRGFGFPGADDLGNMFQYKQEFNDFYVGQRNLDESRSLNPQLLSFGDWLAKYADKIPLE